jgi:hypothetical protein
MELWTRGIIIAVFKNGQDSSGQEMVSIFIIGAIKEEDL